MIATVLIVILLVLQLADLWTTREVLRLGGIERNPVMQTLFAWFGIDVALWGKVILVAVAAFVLLIDYPIVLGALDVLYLAVLANNLRALRHAKG